MYQNICRVTLSHSYLHKTGIFLEREKFTMKELCLFKCYKEHLYCQHIKKLNFLTMLSQTAFNWVFFRQFDQNVLIKAYAYLMMMNCFCGMVDRRKTFILISSWDCCRRSSPSRTSDTTPAEFEPAQNLSSGTVPFRSRKIQL